MTGIFFENQVLEKEENQLNNNGYKYLGWQVHSGNCNEIKKCYELGHFGQQIKDNECPLGFNKVINKSIFEKSYNNRGSHNLLWCEKCKIWWNIDSSD
jgi:hypothetical protein